MTGQKLEQRSRRWESSFDGHPRGAETETERFQVCVVQSTDVAPCRMARGSRPAQACQALSDTFDPVCREFGCLTAPIFADIPHVLSSKPRWCGDVAMFFLEHHDICPTCGGESSNGNLLWVAGDGLGVLQRSVRMLEVVIVCENAPHAAPRRRSRHNSYSPSARAGRRC